MFLDELIEVDKAASRVVVGMPTSAELPLTRAQRTHPVHHPPHLNGGLLVHMAGVSAYVHFYYVFGRRHADGWVGYGTRIHNARFVALAPPGEPLIISCTCTQAREGATRILARYDFVFTQAGNPVYRSDQSAVWVHTGTQDGSTP
jgi:hypothetical protein